MAPEVISGEKYSESADVYSFGIVLYELFAECRVYQQSQHLLPPQMMYAIAKGDLVPDLSYVADRRDRGDASVIHEGYSYEAIKQIIRECIQRQPDNRPSFPEILSRLLRERQKLR